MAKIIPTTITIPQTADHEPDANVDLDWTEIVESLHHIYQRCGAMCPGVTFNPPLQRNTNSLGVVDTGGGRVDLDTWAGLLVFQRRLNSNVHRLRLDAYMRNAQLRLTIVRFDGPQSGNYATHSTLTAIASGTDSKWVSNTLNFTATDVREAGLITNDFAVFYIYAEARANDFATDGIGYLYQFSVREDHRLTGSDLPLAPV